MGLTYKRYITCVPLEPRVQARRDYLSAYASMLNEIILAKFSH